MSVPKRYFHDRLVLLFTSVNSFCILLIGALLLLRIGDSSGRYIVQYRSNLGLNAFKTGGLSALLSFLLFAIAVFALHLFLSMRIYNHRRYISIAILALGLVLLIFAIVVSNALLLYS